MLRIISYKVSAGDLDQSNARQEMDSAGGFIDAFNKSRNQQKQDETIARISDGNPGAMEVLRQLYKHPAYPEKIAGAIGILNEMGWTGSRLYEIHQLVQGKLFEFLDKIYTLKFNTSYPSNPEEGFPDPRQGGRIDWDQKKNRNPEGAAQYLQQAQQQKELAINLLDRLKSGQIDAQLVQEINLWDSPSEYF